ncbi:MAG: bifunctional phosphopantothenoylcysteine decarboxylase/phosphopantothenate--cysteine ligase CoaBC [Chloroflexi bacterium]|nr:bifunctional phosphopantothenoylcysteine decarboxylase/phosphopantothenate--cysteine ligase CoaBC [Chloroflexota bacterium]
MNALTGKRVVLGVCGSIASFKAAQLCSSLVQLGAEVDVILTESAREFVTPLTFQALTRRPVYTDIHEAMPDLSSAHVELGTRADVVVICPATATTLARLAHGFADDLLACTVLATHAPLVLAPAMNVNMWNHPATQANISTLRARGMYQVGPVAGYLAEGITGMGRLSPLEDVIGAVRQALGRGGALAGRRVVVTAGGTHEPLDPVRYIGNRSSGKMGYALAEAARDAGADVTLVSGPVSLPRPWGITVVQVGTASEMADATLGASEGADALIMAAAVADYRPAIVAVQKMKRSGDALRIDLTPNPDILASVTARFGDGLVKVGFAAETGEVSAEATRKLQAKGAHLICANDVTETGSGFGTDTNRVTMFAREGDTTGSEVDHLPMLAKDEVARRIVARTAALVTSANR